MEKSEIATAPEVTNEPEQSNQHQQLIVFKLGDEEYGIHIDQIKEVVLTPHITRMPQTPSYIKGVANIRGNILAIIDLEEKFGLERKVDDTEEERSNYTLVIENQDFNIGILVREVPNTLTVASNDIDQTANIVQGAQGEASYIQGVVKIDGQLIILIDIVVVMQEKDISLALAKDTISKHSAQ